MGRELPSGPPALEERRPQEACRTSARLDLRPSRRSGGGEAAGCEEGRGLAPRAAPSGLARSSSGGGAPAPGAERGKRLECAAGVKAKGRSGLEEAGKGRADRPEAPLPLEEAPDLKAPAGVAGSRGLAGRDGSAAGGGWIGSGARCHTPEAPQV